jgi:hypothetical protein
MEATAFSVDAPSLLVIVVDVDCRCWDAHVAESPVAVAGGVAAASHRIGFEDAVKSLVVFINSYLLMHRQNKLAVLSYSAESADAIFPSAANPAASSTKDMFTPTQHLISEVVAEGLLRAHYSSSPQTEDESLNSKNVSDAVGVPSRSDRRALSSCLSRAMCSE